jgi:hypothetical protein
MNDAEHPPDSNHKDEAGDRRTQGPSLTLMYGLLALAMALAIALAGLIVLPFYRAR